ncbi:MAG: glycosyltransferase [Bacteroidota bacterium]|nr:glycosyltransferase [Bacteroidota bacterium]
MDPKISVILPVYNTEKFIALSVGTILTQSFTDFELIIIDDGSTDTTPAILKEISRSDERMKILTKPHSGIVESLNFGISNSRGKYIARMDGDDAMYPLRLEKQAEHLDLHPGTGLVSCLVEHGGDFSTQEGYATYIHWMNSQLTSKEISLNRFVESPMAHPSVMFRKDVAEQFGAYREGNFPEDYELWLRWMENGVCMEKVPYQLLFWNDLSERLSRIDVRYSSEAFNRIKTDYLVRFLEDKIKGRKIWLCGAGRGTRKKSDLMLDSGYTFGGYLDVDPKKAGKIFNGLRVSEIEEMPSKEEAYFVSYVSTRGAGVAIRQMFAERGYSEGDDFIIAG